MFWFFEHLKDTERPHNILYNMYKENYKFVSPSTV